MVRLLGGVVCAILFFFFILAGCVKKEPPTSDEEERQIFLRTSGVTSVSSNSAVSGGNIVDDGGATISERGVCWSISQNPTLDDDCTSDGSGAGSFSSNLNNLSSDTQYYVRAYATNSDGTAYGNQRNFTTEQEAELPSVTTSSISSITETSAQSGGNVTDDGGATVTDRGVCWSESENPNIDDNCTSDGVGIGEFESTITDLTPDTKYFIRAYATNEQGTGYGEERNFTTESEWPRDTTTEIVEVTNPATGQTWMDRNLGATRAATSMDDEQAYGDLYQWGRAADGHEKRNSGTTSTLSNTDTPGHGDFITSSSGANWDWRSPQNDNLWQGVNGVNNPCPDGYRLPTESEWEAERQSWSNNNRVGAFESPLKLPVAGGRSGSSGSLRNVGSSGRYWSSTVSGTLSRHLKYGSSVTFLSNSLRAYGKSVRCLKD